MTGLLAYFGHHKCGTTSICSILEGVCAKLGLSSFRSHDEYLFDGDIAAFRARSNFDLWMYTNADFELVRPADLLGFHVVRDPRDLIVSAYYSHLHSHDDSNWGRLRGFRPYLRSVSRSDGLIAEMRFCAPFMMDMLHWEYGDPRILELRFEDLIACPQHLFAAAFAHLGLREMLGDAAIGELVAEFSFDRLSGGRRPGEDDPGHHYRHGVPGDWRNHFEPRHIMEFQRLYGPLLFKLGYETDPDWTTAACARAQNWATRDARRSRQRMSR